MAAENAPASMARRSTGLQLLGAHLTEHAGDSAASHGDAVRGGRGPMSRWQSGTAHDEDNDYAWSTSAGTDPDGDAFTGSLGELNDCESAGTTVSGYWSAIPHAFSSSFD